MAWAVPVHSVEEVDRAGAMLIEKGAPALSLGWAYAILNNWRACHSFPLNTVQIGIRRHAKRLVFEVT